MTKKPTPEDLKTAFDERVRAVKMIWTDDPKTLGAGDLVRALITIAHVRTDIGRPTRASVKLGAEESLRSKALQEELNRRLPGAPISSED